MSTALLKRQMAFRRLQSVQIGSYLLGYVLVGIGTAYLGWGVWSLIAAQVVQSTAYSIVVFAQAPHSVVPSFNRSSFHLARFGVKITGANILNWSLSNFDNAFVGRVFGSGALGLYSRAFNTVSTPADAIVSTWQQVLFASCSRAGNRTPALQRAYLASVVRHHRNHVAGVLERSYLLRQPSWELSTAGCGWASSRYFRRLQSRSP